MRILVLLLLAATAEAHEFAPKIVDARESSAEVLRPRGMSSLGVISCCSRRVSQLEISRRVIGD